jgi:hypothetical protein
MATSRPRATFLCETRRNLDGKLECAVAHAPVDIRIVLERWAFGKIAGAGNVGHIVPAGHRVVPVQHGEGDGVHVHVDAIANDEHQDDAADQGKGRADRVAADLQCFAGAVAQQASQVEAGAGFARGECPGRFRFRLHRLRRFVLRRLGFP